MLKIREIKLMSKPGLTLIAITAISVALVVQASLYSSSYYFMQSADAQQRRITFALDTVSRSNRITLEPGEFRGVSVSCGPGERVTGGGFLGGFPDVNVESSFPVTPINGWSAAAKNNADVDRFWTVNVVCAKLVPVSQGPPQDETTPTTEGIPALPSEEEQEVAAEEPTETETEEEEEQSPSAEDNNSNDDEGTTTITETNNELSSPPSDDEGGEDGGDNE